MSLFYYNLERLINWFFMEDSLFFFFFVFSSSICCRKSLQKNTRSVTLFACLVLVDFGKAARHRSGKSFPVLVLQSVWSRERVTVFVIHWCDYSPSVSSFTAITSAAILRLGPRLSGAAFALHRGHTMLILMLSLSQQQIKTSVGGCGTVWAWPDSVTWNTGSEHKQGHCSLKKKLGRNKVDLLPGLGTGMRNPIIVRSV